MNVRDRAGGYCCNRPLLHHSHGMPPAMSTYIGLIFVLENLGLGLCETSANYSHYWILLTASLKWARLQGCDARREVSLANKDGRQLVVAF